MGSVKLKNVVIFKFTQFVIEINRKTLYKSCICDNCVVYWTDTLCHWKWNNNALCLLWLLYIYIIDCYFPAVVSGSTEGGIHISRLQLLLFISLIVLISCCPQIQIIKTVTTHVNDLNWTMKPIACDRDDTLVVSLLSQHTDVAVLKDSLYWYYNY